jgi:hypothetical protein
MDKSEPHSDHRGLMIARQHQTDRAWSMAARGDLHHPTADPLAEAWCRFTLAMRE